MTDATLMYICACMATSVAIHMYAFIAINSKDGFSFFNPIRNYKSWTRMNWFGVILCTTLLHVLLPIYAVCYWVYKLCTFGRKKE